MTFAVMGIGTKMSILIKGMKMPKEDELLCIRIYPSGKVTIDMDLQCKWVAEAVEVLNHGDLVDRDEAADDACLIWGRNSSGDDAAQEIIEHLRKMKAVIPAERSE